MFFFFLSNICILPMFLLFISLFYKHKSLVDLFILTKVWDTPPILLVSRNGKVIPMLNSHPSLIKWNMALCRYSWQIPLRKQRFCCTLCPVTLLYSTFFKNYYRFVIYLILSMAGLHFQNFLALRFLFVFPYEL